MRPPTTTVRSRPASTSIRYWTAAPTAPPPGAIFDIALPASWEVITGGQCRVRTASRCKAHSDPSERPCSTAIAASHHGAIFSRSRHELSTSSKLGATRYREIAVSVSQTAVRTR